MVYHINRKSADYWQQYRRTLSLALPVMLSQIGHVVVQLADSVMVGRLGALPLAAVSFGGTVFFTFFILAMGISMGLTPLTGEMYARGNYRAAASYFQNSILLYGLAGIAAFVLQYSLVPLMHLMGQPPEVVEMAVPYYEYLVWSMIPFMVFAAYKQFLEGVGNTTIAMVIIVASNVINVILNYLLIYGELGFPQMGAAGAGLATLIARICMAVLMIFYFSYRKKFRRYYSFFDRREFSRSCIVSLLSVGVPISLQMFMEGIAFVLTSLMMGWLGTVAIAANQIAILVSNFSFMMVIGVAVATTIRVSHAYGRNDIAELKKVSAASRHLTIAWNAFTALLFILTRNLIPRMFTDDPAVIEVASYLMLFVAAFQFSDGLQAISIGVLRGLQDVKSIMYIAFLSYLVINLPVGYLLAFVLGWGAGGLWAGFIFGLTAAAAFLLLRVRYNYRKLSSVGI